MTPDLPPEPTEPLDPELERQLDTLETDPPVLLAELDAMASLDPIGVALIAGPLEYAWREALETHRGAPLDATTARVLRGAARCTARGALAGNEHFARNGIGALRALLNGGSR